MVSQRWFWVGVVSSVPVSLPKTKNCKQKSHACVFIHAHTHTLTLTRFLSHIGNLEDHSHSTMVKWYQTAAKVVCSVLAPQKIPLISLGRLQLLQEPCFVVTLSSLTFSLTAGMEYFITRS